MLPWSESRCSLLKRSHQTRYINIQKKKIEEKNVWFFVGSDGICAHNLHVTGSAGQITAKLLQITSIIKHSGQDLLKELYWSTFPQFPTLYFIVELMFSFIKSWKTSCTFEPFCYTPKLARKMSLHSIWSTFFVNFLSAKWNNLGPIWDISTLDLAKIIKLHSLPYEMNGLEKITPR